MVLHSQELEELRLKPNKGSGQEDVCLFKLKFKKFGKQDSKWKNKE